jgi:hypothetical protein
MMIFVALVAAPQALAQSATSADPAEALTRALQASAELASATQGDPSLGVLARRASEALSSAVEALKSQPLCRPPPILDPTTFSLLLEELERGNRTGQLPRAMLERTLQRHLLTVAQLEALLQLVPRTDDRLQLISAGNRRLADPENAGELYALFPLKQDQRALAMLLAQ